MNMPLVNNSQKWFGYVQEGNLTKVEKWLNKNKIWINFPDQEGNTALYHAINNRHLLIIQFLIGEGASFFKNFQGKTPWDIAVGQVKIYLESLEPKPKTESFELLIDQKLLNLSSISYEEGMNFIFSLPKTYQTSSLKNYAHSLVFSNPNKVLDLINRIEDEENKNEVLMHVVSTALSCGDVKLATTFKNAISEKYDTYSRFEIRAFMICMKILEDADLRKVFYPDREFSFSEAIKSGLKMLGLLHEETYKQYGEKTTLGMIEAGSFEKAIEYADSLENLEEKAFARCGLSHCGLGGLVLAAQQLSHLAVENYFEENNEQHLEILENAVEGKNFEIVQSYFSDLK